jgi:hypothetical protein
MGNEAGRLVGDGVSLGERVGWEKAKVKSLKVHKLLAVTLRKEGEASNYPNKVLLLLKCKVVQ